MSLSADFSPKAHVSAVQPILAKRRKAPFSLRLSEDERSRLYAEARGVPLGAYIKSKALGSPPLKGRRAIGVSVEDQKALAQILALLGRSHLASNLNQLAKAVHLGVLPVTPETEADLAEACRSVVELRKILIDALGLQTGAAR
ncbi:hypothetical protein [Mycoplana rhizolycopersici]|uniref:Mobilization protein MobC n=1 Tax=Mycoplana rhizolycopersici TaxID=2746702 RepID=A0ABX2QHD2_9HYPH|nr:hypothetical protein [Rhizobium rhizolycopersici]NVP56623.1 hypothetical protein [Rhizobium rhizolycopersici]